MPGPSERVISLTMVPMEIFGGEKGDVSKSLTVLTAQGIILCTTHNLKQLFPL